jgi:hypothetical protein
LVTASVHCPRLLATSSLGPAAPVGDVEAVIRDHEEALLSKWRIFLKGKIRKELFQTFLIVFV